MALNLSELVLQNSNETKKLAQSLAEVQRALEDERRINAELRAENDALRESDRTGQTTIDALAQESQRRQFAIDDFLVQVARK